MKVKTKDEIVRRVLKKMDERSLVGQKKYGSTMMGEIKGQVKNLDRFLVDVQEELMDALLYIESCKECLRNEYEETLLAQYNDGEECEGTLGSHPLCSTDYCPCKEEEIEKRMNIIGQNGNTGEHYNDHHLDVDEFWTSNSTYPSISSNISDYPG